MASVVNTLWPGRSGSQFATDERGFSPKPPDWLWDPPSLPFIGYRGSILRG
jgi:hypothetical protein